MHTPEWERIKPADTTEEVKEESFEPLFESSFKYRAIPLDELKTLDEHGTPFTIKELMELRELHDENDW